ncbi:MAG: HIT family hydrolase [uncultured bacterium (gcode 4)]|uniref:HIT family hydrolase n=1 Tax=uncultured bacterium (gcode 4) TaxID=1234023 RepID=K2AXV4_9BACT|nr:MAG: HIT family hydrolase [uncultured bacterium (gcode 4)]
MIGKILFSKDIVIDAMYFQINQDWEVPIPGFFILAPKRKIKSISEFTDEESIEFMNLLRKIRKWMREVLDIKDVYLFQNEDTDGDFHLWIFPRYIRMEKFGNKIESVRPIMNYAKENMVTDEIVKEVKEYVKIMKEYMKDF